MSAVDPVLEVADLRVTFPSDDGPVPAVDGVSFVLTPGETLGIVGESGSGKSVTSLAIMGLLTRKARISGSVRFRGRELLGLSEKELCSIRGEGIAMVFQDALASLNPVHRVGAQIAEAITCHHELEGEALDARVVELLEVVGIPSARERAKQYPHEYSGGMRQRAMIAMAIANDPAVLIADEPTTALDVTVQAQVLDAVRRVQEATSSAIIMITHDLGVVAGIADRVLVMYAGRPVEQAPVEDVFYRSAHPYTRGLLASLPRTARRADGQALPHIPGNPPSLIALPPGCAFGPRCSWFEAGLCDTVRPTLAAVAPPSGTVEASPDDAAAHAAAVHAAGVHEAGVHESSCLRVEEIA